MNLVYSSLSLKFPSLYNSFQLSEVDFDVLGEPKTKALCKGTYMHVKNI